MIKCGFERKNKYRNVIISALKSHFEACKAHFTLQIQDKYFVSGSHVK